MKRHAQKKETAVQPKSIQKDAPPTNLLELTRQLQQQEETLRQGGGAAGHERQKRLGRLSVRQRLALLLDDKQPFLELNLWAAWQMYPQAGEVAAAGVVTGIGCVHNRPCMVIANDATVKAGAFFPATAKKVLRAQRIAHRCNLPIVYLVDSAGVYLPMQDEVFPDEDDFGRIFRNNAVLSAAGVPQFAAIMGNCVAGGAYLPVLCDKILMTEGSALNLAGPALVKAAIGQEVEAEELGGAAMHSRISGTIDFREKDDPACLRRLRELIRQLGPQWESTEPLSIPAEPEADAMDLYDLIDLEGRREYDVREVLRRICDGGSINEYKPEYGQTLVCAYASLGGQPVGIVASQRQRQRTGRGEVQIGGVIYSDSADKAARFVMDCSQNGLPLIFLQDVMGFMVGRDSEQHGIIRSGAKLVSAVSNTTTPKITLILGGSFGAGNYALCGKAFDPHFIFAWPSARYAVMGAEQATETLVDLQKRQAERDGRKLSESQFTELQKATRDNYHRQTDIRYGAARGWVDAIIAPDATRSVLIQALRLAMRPAPAGGFRAGVIQV